MFQCPVPLATPSDSVPRSKNNHVTGLFRTFLKAHSILWNPFLPCNIDGSRRLSSTTAKLISLVANENVYCARKTYRTSPFHVSSLHNGWDFRSARSPHKSPYSVQVLGHLVLGSAEFDCGGCSDGLPSTRVKTLSSPDRPSDNIRTFPNINLIVSR